MLFPKVFTGRTDLSYRRGILADNHKTKSPNDLQSIIWRFFGGTLGRSVLERVFG